MAMDNGDLEFSNHEKFLGSHVGNIPSSGSMNSFFNDIINDTHACTHIHTCKPPGTDSSHAHSFYHVDSKILPSLSGDDQTLTKDTAESSKKNRNRRSSGNLTAVRKYREKKKARAASLEVEAVRLRALNQQLMKRVQTQVGLEAEVGRLKCLLLDLRGRIDGELGSFPYQKQQPVNQSVVNPNLDCGFMWSPASMQQDASVHHDLDTDGCDVEELHCVGNQGSLLNEVTGCGANDGLVTAKPSSATKRKG